MIPKIIHCVWFGGKPMPEKEKMCIESWEKMMPDYEIMIWNETNFDVNKVRYVKEAYVLKNMLLYLIMYVYGRYIIMAVYISIQM